MSKIGIAVLGISIIAIDIQVACPADLSFRPKHVHKKVIDRQPELSPAAKKEILFQEYLEWRKNRTIEDLFRQIPLVLRGSIDQ